MICRLSRILCAALLIASTPALAEPIVSHGLAMHGTPKYPADFTHLDYVNPDAPKGGTLRMMALGGFDTLNPYTLKGMSAAGLGLTYETLTTSAADEPFSVYGLVAKTITVPEDRSWVRFDLHPEARWHDGQPITADDVVFSFETLKSKGHPFYRSYYASITKAEAKGKHAVVFTFDKAGNRELPLIVGQMPILPKHYWQDKDFAATTLNPPVGSGPYKIAKFDTGRSITYERVKDYWGKDLPMNKGRYNFNVIHYDYYRDTTVALEAFKAGAYDINSEYESKKWATGYNFPAVADGRVIKAEIPKHTPSGMQGYVFNTRRELFQDPIVRQAIGYAFDFEWTNKTLFYGAYKRINSYFDNSELGATRLPDAAELKLLEPYRDQLPPEVFTTVYKSPTVEGKYGLRKNLRIAMKLLKSAGWELQNGVLTKNGQPLAFEILTHTAQGTAMERVTLPYIKNLKKIGIQATFRAVDVNQYQNRVQQFDYDVRIAVYGQSLSPGNEQIGYFGSATADRAGSRNYAGVKDPIVDALIDKIIHAESREDLVTATRALDRVLLWSHYVVPQWYLPYDRLAYWDRFGKPDTLTLHGTDTWAWWVDPAKDAALKR